MATRSKAGNTDMKGFYKQRKSSGIGGTSKSKNTKPQSRTPPAAASLGSAAAQPTALISHGSIDLEDDYEKQEMLLRQFDMNISYGPCVGMSRISRWERACNLGLDPPKEVETLLKGGKVSCESLWDGRI